MEGACFLGGLWPQVLQYLAAKSQHAEIEEQRKLEYGEVSCVELSWYETLAVLDACLHSWDVKLVLVAVFHGESWQSVLLRCDNEMHPGKLTWSLTITMLLILEFAGLCQCGWRVLFALEANLILHLYVLCQISLNVKTIDILTAQFRATLENWRRDSY